MPPTGALDAVVGRLVDARAEHGCWDGELSTSALSTATAVFALHLVERQLARESAGRPADADLASLVRRGREALVLSQNVDGGWGDTTRSKSNLSTTTLCWCALGSDRESRSRYEPSLRRAEEWLSGRIGSLEPGRLAAAISGVYGKDRTFSVPILTMATLAGRLGDSVKAWSFVRPLPFELAALPHRWFRHVGLPVVSYALPALIGIGQARFHHRPGWNPITRVLRATTRARTLRVLERLQPSNGGFLEATPLTAFVTMSLAASGEVDHPATRRGVDFLVDSVREDGSWPIDTNLRTWVTTLSINALADAGVLETGISGEARAALLDVLLSWQHGDVHPYTAAAPGAWAWTDLPGGVPDADDTAGALLALHHLGRGQDHVREAATRGIRWLLELQNRDGGVPTFCRGWGKLPFDRSGADLTAHALRAFLAWWPAVRETRPEMAVRMSRSLRRMIAFLGRNQGADGTWCPLWFGNEHVEMNENPVYGTSRVVRALRDAGRSGELEVEPATRRGVAWLVDAQNGDGGWGGGAGAPSSIEESALALEALSGLADVRGPVQRGVEWLTRRIETGGLDDATPIGFYFANLWYYEKLYPTIFSVAALGRVTRDDL